MRGEVVVRSATPEDAGLIRGVGSAAWPETYDFAGEGYVRRGLEQWWSPEAVRRGSATTTTLVAEVGTVVVGMGDLDLHGEVPVVWTLYFSPGHQGRGVGGALLRALLDLVPGRPVELEHVAGDERAAAFYARHGFREVRREPAECGAVLVWLRRDAPSPAPGPADGVAPSPGGRG
ncbi:GNAT family N-acetyltransferase [Pseudokineococcus basanitobsidens]|uniref:GNAT family N-acetyltransferase n=1 Tax=Pseudokineococcus basanitobsidens TaxID=1926649 RepID=A0ABU8RMS3_9ACTN